MPELPKCKNPLDLGLTPRVPSLKNIVLIGDIKVPNMINFKDLETIFTSEDEREMHARERKINFDSPTNI